MASSLIDGLAKDLGPLMSFLNDSPYMKRMGDPSICDFVFGNPHEMPLPGLVDALTRWSQPQNKDWFAYKMSEEPARAVVAESLRQRRGIPFEPADIALTTGTFGALSVALRTLIDPGDEVIFLSPPWFFYEPMIRVAGATPVRLTLKAPAFEPDPETLASAVTPRTRAVLINSPHNPTGRVYSRERLTLLAATLREASEHNGRRIYLLSDESYNRILFDEREFVSPAAVYDDTLVLYTYGKTLLAPGERIGYIAVPPAMEERDELRDAIFLAQVVGGWQFPNAVLQHAIADLESLSIDVPALQRRRDRLGAALDAMGYDVMMPEATFYMMVRSPLEDDVAFTGLLADQDVFVGPGLIFEMPGYFRISLTANDDMVERALPVFEEAVRRQS